TINYQLSTINYQPSGFSFAEVMFAVIILGIGFIMIAAVFPVAVQQGKATNDETTAAASAKAQVAMLSDVIADADVPVPTGTPIPMGFGVGSHVFGQVYSLRDPQPDTKTGYPWLNNQVAPWVLDQTWEKVRGNLVSSTDPRFASVVLYRRDSTVG